METVDNEVLQALSARKSVRVYTDEPVTEAERNAILQAAFQAPTAGNQQLYTILNITDPALKARLADLCDHQPFIAKAPLVLVFLADCRRWLQAYKAAGIEDVRTPGVGDLLLAMADTCIAAQNAVPTAFRRVCKSSPPLTPRPGREVERRKRQNVATNPFTNYQTP